MHTVGKEITITLEDEKAIEIVEALPDTERDRIIERYILLGDTVARYAAITASDDSFAKFFNTPLMQLQNIADSLAKAGRQLEETLPVKIDAHTGGISGKIEATVTSLTTSINESRTRLETQLPESVKSQVGEAVAQITATTEALQNLHKQYEGLLTEQHTALGRVIPTLSKSSTRGAVTNEAIFQSLQEGFRTDAFTDISGKSRYTDITAEPPGTLHPILIELKDYTNDVPSKEVDKFWRDMEARNAQIGCFFSMYTRIQTVTSDFCIIANGNRIGIFMVNEVFNHQGHTMAYAVARKLLEVLNTQSGGGDADKYDFMVRVLNNQLRTIRDHMKDLEQIKQDILDAQAKIDKDLNKAADRVGNLRTRIEGIVDDIFRDFAAELTDGKTGQSND